jgi:hypothetical protein
MNAPTTPPQIKDADLEKPVELQRDPIGGGIFTSDENPSVREFVSRYHGKLYIAMASVVDEQIDRTALRSPSITNDCDSAIFKLAAGEIVPSHPGSRLFNLWFDSVNTGYDYKPGASYRIAFTEAGTYIAIWAADLTVVPGAYDPRLDDPNASPTKIPPAFDLIYLDPARP